MSDKPKYTPGPRCVEIAIPGRLARLRKEVLQEVLDLIDEHLRYGGPFNSKLLDEFAEVVTSCDTIVVTDEEKNDAPATN